MKKYNEVSLNTSFLPKKWALPEPLPTTGAPLTSNPGSTPSLNYIFETTHTHQS